PMIPRRRPHPPKSRRQAAVCALALLLSVLPGAAPGAELAVPGAHATLAEALAAAAPGDVVMLAGGTYTERDLTLPPGITLRGRSGERVVLDAESLGRHFVVQAGGDTVVESIEFRNGITLDRRRRDGGSLLVDRDASLTLRHCSFTGMHSSHFGGTIAAQPGATLVLEGCTFENSRATQNLTGQEMGRRHVSRDNLSHGGVIHMGRRTHLTATDCSFVQSHAKDGGGAVFIDVDGVAAFTRCRFENGTCMEGGAVSAKEAALGFDGCTFRNNATTRTYRAPGRGGAIFQEEGSLRIAGCSFEGNLADQGGGIYLFQTTAASIEGSLFAADTANGGGGALMAIGVPTTIRNTVFRDNVAAKTSGGAILFGRATLALANCTLHANVAARDGSAIYASTPIEVTLDRCIVSAGRGATALDGIDGRTMELTCCNLSGNEGGDWVRDLAARAAEDGNVSVDPRYRDADGGNLALADDSPCRDAKGCGRMGANREENR
ncbi:right-handed parallel beta-helix repeat-containing protein, partial [bacterium]|nr:right-handed parallel beta-helix repeat-containing protein [bacterium]